MRNDTAIGTTMINVKGVALNVSIEPGDGNGPPLLLINGIGANLELFDPFIEALDNVGGQKIGTIRFDVLGISWGGALAQEFAHQYSSRCRRLILMSTSSGGISVPGKPGVLGKMISPRRYFDPSYMAAIALLLYGDAFRQNAYLAHSYEQLIKAPLGRVYIIQLLAGVGWTSIAWLHRLRQPTFILARLIPNATLHILNGGHLFILSEKEQVPSLVHTSLRDDSTSGKRG